MKSFLLSFLMSGILFASGSITNLNGGQPGSGTGNVVSINSDTSGAVTLSVGTSGTDFSITDSPAGTHVFNLPSASAANRGVVTTGAQTLAGAKTFSTAPILSSITASRALVTDGSSNVAASAVTGTELGYVSGVTSAIQTQLNAKQATITTGTTAQYLRGDLSLATLNATAVGLANVANVNQQNASNLTSGTVADARLSSNVTLLGNSFNGASQLVQLTAGGILPVLDGSNLTGLNNPVAYAVTTSNGTATTITTQTLSDVSSYTCHALISGFRTDAQDTGHWLVMGSAYRSGGGCVFEDSTKLYEKRSDVMFSADWSCSGNDFLLKVTGNSGKTISWKADVVCKRAN